MVGKPGRWNFCGKIRFYGEIFVVGAGVRQFFYAHRGSHPSPRGLAPTAKDSVSYCELWDGEVNFRLKKVIQL
jgi:hypothetical protein